MLEELEHSMGIRLLKDYKDFMLKHNGDVSKNHLSIQFLENILESDTLFEQETDVREFSKIEELPFFYDNLSGTIPEKHLSISCDSCGNEILLCVEESNNYGKVYFGDHELYDPETDYMVMSLIANSFSEFIDKCKSIE